MFKLFENYILSFHEFKQIIIDSKSNSTLHLIFFHKNSNSHRFKFFSIQRLDIWKCSNSKRAKKTIIGCGSLFSPGVPHKKPNWIRAIDQKTIYIDVSATRRNLAPQAVTRNKKKGA